MAGLIWDRLLSLAECLCREVDDSGRMCFCGILPGQQAALDYCQGCDGCGMAWVRLDTRYPSTVLGQIDRSARSCVAPIESVIEVGVARCAPIGDQQPPGVGEWLETSAQVVADSEAMVRAIRCCFGTKDYILGQYAGFGPAGGCVGGTWNVYVSDL